MPTLVNASAVGYYGDTRDRTVDETAPAGTGFLARLCVDWEAATEPAVASGRPGGAGAHRVWCSRRRAACWAGCEPLFSLGLGARLGNGRQYMPWISLEDEVRALMFAISHDDAVRPGEPDRPGTGHQCRVHRRAGPRGEPADTDAGARFRVARWSLGEFADEGLLVGQRAIPAALERAGFALPPQHHRRGAGVRDDTLMTASSVDVMTASIRSSADPVEVRQLGTRRLPGRLAAATRSRRRPGRRRPGHAAAAGASAGVHRRAPHRTARTARGRHARRRHRPRRQDHLARPRPAGRLSDHRPGRAARCGEFRSAP